MQAEIVRVPPAGIVFYVLEYRDRDPETGRPFTHPVVEYRVLPLPPEDFCECGAVELPAGARVLCVLPTPRGMVCVFGRREDGLEEFLGCEFTTAPCGDGLGGLVLKPASSPYPSSGRGGGRRCRRC